MKYQETLCYKFCCGVTDVVEQFGGMNYDLRVSEENTTANKRISFITSPECMPVQIV